MLEVGAMLSEDLAFVGNHDSEQQLTSLCSPACCPSNKLHPQLLVAFLEDGELGHQSRAACSSQLDSQWCRGVQRSAAAIPLPPASSRGKKGHVVDWVLGPPKQARYTELLHCIAAPMLHCCLILT